MSERRGKLKVYGVNTFLLGVQARTIACVTSQKEFAARLGVSVGYVQTYAAETGNAEELELVKADPRAVFIKCPTCRRWHKWERGQP